jgi:hypothetical protein
MESMAISWKVKPELSELRKDWQSEKVENSVGSNVNLFGNFLFGSQLEQCHSHFANKYFSR